MTKQEFITKAADEATRSFHPWPEYAACEAALESNFGDSSLAAVDNNLFGTKQHTHPVYGTVNLPTREFLHGSWVTVEAEFVKYPDWESSFRDRYLTLQRLAPRYPFYWAALKADSGEEFVTEVSKTWSTDPQRAAKVLAIHKEFYQ